MIGISGWRNEQAELANTDGDETGRATTMSEQTGSEGDADKPKNRPRWLLVSGIAAALLLITGFLAARLLLSSPEDEAARLVPEEAIGYINVFLDPSFNQKRALQDLLGHFPEGSSDDAREQLVDLIDRGLGGIDASFEEDLAPWLGDQAAAFMLMPEDRRAEPSAAALIRSDDDDRAAAFLQKVVATEGGAEESEHDGTEYAILEQRELALGIVDGFVVVGDVTAFEAVVDTAGGESALASNDRFLQASSSLPDDRLLSLFLDGRRLWDYISDEFERADVDPRSQGILIDDTWETMSAGAYATSDSVVMEAALELREDQEDAAQLVTAFGGETAVLEEMPATSWGTVALPDLGQTLDAFIDMMVQMQPPGTELTRENLEKDVRLQTGLDLDSDVLAWMGDASMFISGTDLDSLAGGVIVETEDALQARITIRKIQSVLENQGAAVDAHFTDFGEGFSIQDYKMDEPVTILVGRDRLIAAYTWDATIAAMGEGDLLRDVPRFRRAAKALGDIQPGAYLDIPSMLSLIEDSDTGGDPAYREQVKPWLESLSFFTHGMAVDGRRVTQKIIVGVE